MGIDILGAVQDASLFDKISHSQWILRLRCGVDTASLFFGRLSGFTGSPEVLLSLLCLDIL